MSALLDFRDLDFAEGIPALLQGSYLAVKGGDRLDPLSENCGNGASKGTLPCLGQSGVTGRFPPAGRAVLQHPADQLIGATVGEDVAFDLKSLGYPTSEVQQRVHQTLAMTKTWHLADRVPSPLAGGEQPKGAMQPQLILSILSHDPTFLDTVCTQTLLLGSSSLCPWAL